MIVILAHKLLIHRLSPSVPVFSFQNDVTESNGTRFWLKMNKPDLRQTYTMIMVSVTESLLSDRICFVKIQVRVLADSDSSYHFLKVAKSADNF